MKKLCSLACALWLVGGLLYGQAALSLNVDPGPFAASIQQADLKKHLTVLASDEFEGRETGTAGNRKAAQYIADAFRSFGLPPVGADNSYFQPIAFNWSSWQKVVLSAGDQDFKHLWDFYAYPTRNKHQELITATEVIFLGYGIDDKKYSDYKGVDVKGKVIMIYKDEPTNKKGISYISGSPNLSAWTTDWRKKLETAYQKGVKAVLIIDGALQKEMSQNRNRIIGSQVVLGEEAEPGERYANNCYISTKIAKTIMGDQFKRVIKARKRIKRKGKSKKVVMPCDFKLTMPKKIRTLSGENVLGYIEGTDEQLKNELVVITAHYDHLGRKGEKIFNGADDNGSGTSTVLEVAEAFAEAKKAGLGPRRSVLVMLVTGEEKGLLGSKYYTEKPLFPIENTVANVNVDMDGRVDKKHEDAPNYIYVIGSDRLSSELHDINENSNATYTQLTLDYTYNAEDDPNRYYYRSDHYNFAEKGIPAIFYFNGTHDDYHRPTDTVDKINFEKMEKIGRLVFYTSWELANRAERIKVDKGTN